MLKRGSKGKEVLTLQSALDLLGFSPGALDGNFGPRTEKAVRAFQAARSLVVDGIVGPKTKAKLERGLDELKAQELESSVMSGHILQPLKMRQVRSLSELGNPASRAWQRDHLASFAIVSGFPMSKVFCHREFGPVLRQVFTEIKAAGHAKRILSYAGCYNLRPVRGGKRWSAHAFGAAIDLNALQNPMGRKPAPGTGVFKADDPIVAIFKTHGCSWGGDFKIRPDGMHFCGCGRF